LMQFVAGQHQPQFGLIHHHVTISRWLSGIQRDSRQVVELPACRQRDNEWVA
jgi:hypothetical protein